MSHDFRRTGDLKSIGSYPVWVQRVVRETGPYKQRVVEHELFALMRDAKLPRAATRRFLVGVWPTIEQFPRFMAMNLKKIGYGDSVGEDMAHRYLIQSIRVEQKHAEHWAAWAGSAGLTLHDLRTGEWSCVVCSKDTYAQSLPDAGRSAAMRWLKVHAEHDDTHPWEALDIVATLLGHSRAPQEIAEVRRAIQSGYTFMAMALDSALMATMHGSFDETASNASTLGFDALDAA